MVYIMCPVRDQLLLWGSASHRSSSCCTSAISPLEGVTELKWCVHWHTDWIWQEASVSVIFSQLNKFQFFSFCIISSNCGCEVLCLFFALLWTMVHGIKWLDRNIWLDLIFIIVTLCLQLYLSNCMQWTLSNQTITHFPINILMHCKNCATALQQPPGHCGHILTSMHHD